MVVVSLLSHSAAAVVVTGISGRVVSSLQFCAKVKERLHVCRIKKAARPKKGLHELDLER